MVGIEFVRILRQTKEVPKLQIYFPKVLTLCFDKMHRTTWIFYAQTASRKFFSKHYKNPSFKIFVRAERRTLGRKEGLGFWVFPPSFRSKRPFEMCGIALIISGVPIDSSSLLPESGSDCQPLSSPAPESKRVRFRLFSH